MLSMLFTVSETLALDPLPCSALILSMAKTNQMSRILLRIVWQLFNKKPYVFKEKGPVPLTPD